MHFSVWQYFWEGSLEGLNTSTGANEMTDTDILARHNFTPEQAADAMRKAPAKRTPREQALIRDLVNHA